MKDRTASDGDSSGNIDLMGWDTAFALRLDALNASIVAQKTTPKSFSATDTIGGASVLGTWDDWSVTGGEGDGIFLKCPVKTGTLTIPGTAEPIALDGGYVNVEITLITQPSGKELPDTTAKPGSGRTKLFKANQTTDQFQAPTVQLPLHFSKKVSGPSVYGAAAAFGTYFTNNVAQFDAVFAAVRLEEQAIETGPNNVVYQWLKPAESLYAMASVPGDASKAAFAILSVTKPPSGSLPQQNFDIRMFDVFGTAAPETNSVLAISAPIAMQHIVLTSAQHCVMGATVDDFEIVNDGITVTNKKTLKWGNFKLQKGSEETVTPTIAPGNFQLTLDGMNFHLSISQAAFTTPDGTADVKLTADQYFNMEAVALSDGKYYLKPSPGLGTNSIRADVSPNKGFEIAMIIESVVVGVVLGFMGAGLGEALGGAASGAVDGADGVVNAGADEIGDEVGNLSDSELEEAENSAMEDAASAIKSGGEDASGKTGIFANKWKVWGGIIGGLGGIPIGVLPQIMQAIWNDRITEGKVPTIDDFAANFSQAIQWPEVSSWQVTGGTFRSAFLLGGKAQ